MSPLPPCHACGRPLTAVADLSDWPLIASDIQLWRAPVGLAFCKSCGLLQKPTTPQWQDASDAIYAAYQPHHMGGGAEQKLRADDGRLLPRSQVVLERLLASVPLPDSGEMLDFGCGNGSALRSFAALQPGWRLTGHEWDAHLRATIEAVGPQVRFSSGDIAALDRRFDLITLFHSLEHVPDPLSLLKTLRGKLKPGGTLLIQVPNVWANFYDLLIVDHCSHFAPRNVVELVRQAGFPVARLASPAEDKEISVLGRLVEDEAGDDPAALPALSVERAHAGLAWLEQQMAQCRSLRDAGGGFGLFGTSIAGTWLGEVLERRFDFFLDEDEARIGRRYLDVPVLRPEQAPAGATVYIPLPGDLPGRIARRLAGLPLRFESPPEIA